MTTELELTGGAVAPSPRGFGPKVGGLGRATMLVSSSTVVSRGVGLVASLAGATILGAERLGAFAFMGATAGVLGALGVLGFGPLVTRAIADSGTAEAARAKAAFVISCSVVLLVLVAACYLLLSSSALGIVPGSAEASTAAAVSVALWGIGTGVNPLLSAVISGYKRFKAVTALTVFRAVLVGGGSVTGALAGGGAAGAALGSAVGELVCALTALTLILRANWVSRSVREGWRDGGLALLRAAAAAGLASLVIQGSMWGGQALLLQTPSGFADNGGFLLANRLLLVVTFIPNALAMTSLPYLADRRASALRRRHTARRVIGWSLLTSVPVAGVFAALSYWLLPLLGEEYAAYRQTVLIMSGVGVAVAANNVLGTLAVATGRLRVWVVSDVVLAAVMLLSAMLLVSSYGANGLAVAYLAGYIASASALTPVLRSERSSSKNKARNLIQ